ncbi:sortase [Longilinea arvoryzae]|uniref:Sortase n=1 Tax=Longilinea arvoryzae TaxID=360412 RepID=A0A0K8MY19_9CHLR|nr:arsinothricin resistance N-acetyltransferase ArsN1 family B [Longilinea arvoryzae]GAP16149.1 sortase [Longilinea arvoryzae]
MIRQANLNDSAAMAQIYNPFILDTCITFEVDPVDAAEMTRRMGDVAAASLPWLVVEQDGKMAGYCYAHPWMERAAYQHTVESTIYLAPEFQRRGLGRQLYRALLAELKKRPVHAVISIIALPNPASVGLHESLGFEKVAHFREVGRKFEGWIDVGYWQLMMEEWS